MDMEEITSRSNALLRHMRRLADSASYRRERREFLCDSPKLLDEALLWHAPVQAVVFTRGTAVPALPDGVRAAAVPEDVMASVSPMKTPQGVAFTCRMEPRPLPEKLTGRRYVVLDGVQDPGNVGTVLRTADAFECNGAVLLDGCADLYGPKTVRASMGAVFRIPVWNCTVPELAGVLGKSDLPLYGAALQQDTEDVRTVDLHRAALAVGSEGHGLSEEVLALCRKTIRIPMAPRCESLNAAAAAAVLLWEAYR